MTGCLACGGVLRTWRGDIAVCRSCGTSSRKRRLEASERESHYASYYEAIPPLSPLTAARLKAWAGWLRLYRRTGRTLEVGCGAGHFLTAAEAAGFEAWGTEIAISALDRLRARGFRVLAGNLPDLQLPADHFDAVILFEVLEHLDDPLTYLLEARRVVRQGGALLLTTPNFNSLSRRLLGHRWRVVDPEHLILFTPRGLRIALERAGFRIVSIWSRNMDPTELVRVLHGKPVRGTEERQRGVDACRERLAADSGLLALREVVNLGLRALGLGDTCEARAER